jgi:hypothetical protein
VRRRLFNLAAAVSLVLVVLSFAALGASISVAGDSFSRMDGERLAWEGGYEYFRERFPFAVVLGLAALGIASGLAHAVVIRRGRRIALLAVACNFLWAAWWGRYHVPCWSVAVAGSVLSAGWAVCQMKSRLRSRSGLCPTCNYDLRATPERCPECGTQAKPQPAEGAAA